MKITIQFQEKSKLLFFRKITVIFKNNFKYRGYNDRILAEN